MTSKHVVLKNLFVTVSHSGTSYNLYCINVFHDGTASPISFVKSLGPNIDQAMVKVQEFKDKLKNLIPHCKVDYFAPEEHKKTLADLDLEQNLSTTEKNFLMQIHNGIMPFGKYRGLEVAKLPLDYMIWLYKQGAENCTNALVATLANVCFSFLIKSGVLNSEDDLNQLYNERSKEHLKLSGKSKFVGVIGERKTLTAVILHTKSTWDHKYNKARHFYKLIAEDNIFIYSGSSFLGETNDTVEITATINCHQNYNGTLSTLIARPRLLKRVPLKVQVS